MMRHFQTHTNRRWSSLGCILQAPAPVNHHFDAKAPDLTKESHRSMGLQTDCTSWPVAAGHRIHLLARMENAQTTIKKASASMVPRLCVAPECQLNKVRLVAENTCLDLTCELSGSTYHGFKAESAKSSPFSDFSF